MQQGGPAHNGVERKGKGSRLVPAQKLCVRRDLQIQAVDSDPSQGEKGRWIVFDPTTRECTRIGWLEHWWLTRLDGKVTTTSLLKRFHTENPQFELSESTAQAILDQILASNLVRPQGLSGPHRDLFAKSGVHWQAWIATLVVWRIRGIYPDRWLGGLAPHTGVFFSARAVRIWLAVALVTCLAVILEFPRLSLQASIWDWLVRPATGGMLFLVFLVTRGLHELGHALVCKRHGVRCPDIGLLVILGAPCVYCDVSESWRLPSRWQRAAVAAAGMYVELIVATVAAWIWMLTVDGPVNTLALQTMFVCSVSTVLINANPLMRFDGYYILADWLDEANLRSKADKLAHAQFQTWVLGNTPANVQSTPDENAEAMKQADPATAFRSTSRNRPSNVREHLLCGFAWAGWAYRAVLSVTIASVIVTLYSNWNLLWLGRMLAATVLISWWGVPMLKLSTHLWKAAASGGRRWRLAAVAATAVVVFAVVPVPHRRFASGWMQPAEIHGVFATTTARLVDCAAQDGQIVDAAQRLFELENSTLVVQAIQRESDVEAALARRNSKRRERDMHNQDIDLSIYESNLENAKTLAENTLRRVEELQLKAPAKGIFCAALADPAAELDSPERTPLGNQNWTSPLQLGRAVPQGTLLGTVCSSNSVAVIPLDESQLADITSGTQVRIRVPELHYRVTKAQVKEVVHYEKVSQLWHSLMEPGTNASRHLSPTRSRYAAIVEVPESLRVHPGSSVNAVFVVPSGTLARTCIGWLNSNLRLLAE